MHDAGKDSHERRIRMADDHKTDKGEETTTDGRHDHTAHVAADRARKDGDHKAVRGLLLLTDDGANLVMHARVVAGHPVGKHQTKEDHEQLRGRIGDEREHTAAKLGSNLRHILRCHGNQRRKIIVQILLERRVVERLGMRDHLVEVATRNTKLLGQAAQYFHDLTKENRRQDANDTDEHGNNNNKRDKRTDAAIHAMVLEPIGDRGHHKSNDGADGKKLNNRCQDAHKVKDDSSNNNAADNGPNAQRQNAGVAQHAIGLLGVLTHERIITPSGSILS